MNEARRSFYMGTSRTCWALALALTFVSYPASATRYAGRPKEISVAESDWIFTGFILRNQSFQSAFVGGVDVQYTIQVGRILRGTIPKTIVVRGNAAMPTGAGRTFVFFANRLVPPVSGIHGTLQYGGIRPLKELKAIEQLVAAKPPPK